MLGVDGSSHSRRAAAFLARLSPRAGGRATVVSVVEPMRAPVTPLMPAAVRAQIAGEVERLQQNRLATARRQAEAAARELGKAGWRAGARVVSGVPLAELLGAVKHERADLLVLGARGTTGLERLLLGSVSEGALKQSPVPVVIVK